MSRKMKRNRSREEPTTMSFDNRFLYGTDSTRSTKGKGGASGGNGGVQFNGSRMFMKTGKRLNGGDSSMPASTELSFGMTQGYKQGNVLGEDSKGMNKAFGKFIESLTEHKKFSGNKKAIILYEDCEDTSVEIGLVDLKVPDIKSLGFVLTQTKIDMDSLTKYCELLNHPCRISQKDYQGLSAFITTLNSFKSDISNRVLNDLKRHLLTDTGVKNISQLLSCNEKDKMASFFFKEKNPEVISFNKLKEETKWKRNNSIDQLNPPFNKACLPALSYILEKVRIKRPLTDQEENRLVSFIRELLKLPSKVLVRNFKIVLKNSLLSKNQLETLVELLPHYSRVDGQNGTFMRGSNLCPSTCNDLSVLISRLPNLQLPEIRRLNKYIKDLSCMDVWVRKHCLSLMKAFGHLTLAQIRFLEDNIDRQNYPHNTRLLIF